MNVSDRTTYFGLISRINHWLGALLVIILLGIGLYFHEMPKGDERSYWLGIHIGIGAVSFLLLAFRIIWRGINRHTQAAEQAALAQKLSHITHALLLLAILIMIITGPLIIWTAARPINVFDLFSIPSPLPKMMELHEILETIHKVTSRVLLVLIGVHVLAAIKHALITPQVLAGRRWGRPN